MNRKLLLFAVTLAVLFAIGGAFLVMQKRRVVMNQPVVNEPVIETSVQTESENPTDTSDWKTYRNEEYGFEFIMPAEWSIEKTNTPALFYLKSEHFEPVLLGYNYKNEPFYSRGEISISVSSNPKNISIRERYLQYDDVSRLYFVDETEGVAKMPHQESIVNGHSLFDFGTHRGFGGGEEEYITTKILKIKNKILHFDYISKDAPDLWVRRVLEEVVKSVSDTQ